MHETLSVAPASSDSSISASQARHGSSIVRSASSIASSVRAPDRPSEHSSRTSPDRREMRFRSTSRSSVAPIACVTMFANGASRASSGRLALLHHELHQGLIPGQLDEVGAAEQVRPAVADLPDHGLELAGDGEHGRGRPHAAVARLAIAHGAQRLGRGLQGAGDAAPDLHGHAVGHRGRDDVRRHRARHLSTRGAPHAVTHREPRGPWTGGGDEHDVFVVPADVASDGPAGRLESQLRLGHAPWLCTETIVVNCFSREP